jgi:CDP-glucose 4,6-dehydratase
MMKAFHDTYRGRRVLVTGHTGFKGSWMAYWLSLLGAEVTGLSLDPEDDQPLFGRLGLAGRLAADQRVDVRDASGVERVVRNAAPDVVFHLAAQSLVRRSYDEPVGTFATNMMGVVNVLEAVRQIGRPCIVVVVSTDKCYENQNRLQGYSEVDRLGGHDPYSASKACAEIITASYRQSFFSSMPQIKLASARAGNVIGGGDWSKDRLVPDCIRALRSNEPIPVRNKTATRPWQHVLEPLSGYLWLAAAIASPKLLDRSDAGDFCEALNFGPNLASNRTVQQVVEELLTHTRGSWKDFSDPNAPHEAAKLSLAIDKAFHLLHWSPTWNFAESIGQTVEWYEADHAGKDLVELTRRQIEQYSAAAEAAGQTWARET